jgi:tubulin alpha
MHDCLEHEDITLPFDNRALYNICSQHGVENPNYANINRLIAQAASSVTAPMRFRGTLNTDITELNTNLVPYPRTHFLLVSLSHHLCSKTLHG